MENCEVKFGESAAITPAQRSCAARNMSYYIRGDLIKRAIDIIEQVFYDGCVTQTLSHRPDTCQVCNAPLPVARNGRPRLTCSATCYQAKRLAQGALTRAHRPSQCRMCGKALAPATRGRVRLTCSDRCRQRKRRWNYETWIEPQRWKKAWRRAAREVRRMEKGVGSLDIPTPGFPYLTLAKRVQIRLQRGDPAPFCKVCRKPYINDTPRRTPTCRGTCAAIYRERQKALEAGLKQYAGQYDPRVDVRLRLGLPIKTCQHCGKPFPDYHPRRVYCSKKCCDAAWYAQHPKRVCSGCGVVYRGKRKTCSDTCRQRRHRKTGLFCDRCQHAIKPGRAMRYEVSYNGPDPQPIRNHHGKLIPFQEAVFCSAKCRDALGWSPSRKVCVKCNEAYYPSSKRWQRRQKYCSRKCAQRVPYEGPRQKICEHCGKAYPPGHRNWRKQQYCSKGCADLARYYRKRAGGVLVTLPEPIRVRVEVHTPELVEVRRVE